MSGLLLANAHRLEADSGANVKTPDHPNEVDHGPVLHERVATFFTSHLGEVESFIGVEPSYVPAEVGLETGHAPAKADPQAARMATGAGEALAQESAVALSSNSEVNNPAGGLSESTAPRSTWTFRDTLRNELAKAQANANQFLKGR